MIKPVIVILIGIPVYLLMPVLSILFFFCPLEIFIILNAVYFTLLMLFSYKKTRLFNLINSILIPHFALFFLFIADYLDLFGIPAEKILGADPELSEIYRKYFSWLIIIAVILYFIFNITNLSIYLKRRKK